MVKYFFSFFVLLTFYPPRIEESVVSSIHETPAESMVKRKFLQPKYTKYATRVRKD